jgi:hypothetical protein
MLYTYNLRILYTHRQAYVINRFCMQRFYTLFIKTLHNVTLRLYATNLKRRDSEDDEHHNYGHPGCDAV